MNNFFEMILTINFVNQKRFEQSFLVFIGFEILKVLGSLRMTKGTVVTASAITALTDLALPGAANKKRLNDHETTMARPRQIGDCSPSLNRLTSNRQCD